MGNKKSIFGRFLAGLLCLVMVASVGSVFVFAEETAKTPNAIVVSASDLQGGDFEMKGNMLAPILKMIRADYESVDQMLFVGDLTQEVGSAEASNFGANVVQTKLNALWPEDFPVTDDKNSDNILFSTGNHDTAGFALQDASGGYDMGDYYVYLINEADFPARKPKEQTDALIKQDRKTVENTAAELKTYLDGLINAGVTQKPVFVMNHLPLHLTTRGDNRNAKLLVDVLNEAGRKGLDIFYLYGHNHSQAYDTYMGGSCVFQPASSTILVQDPAVQDGTTAYEETPIYFTYMTAGYVGYAGTLDPNVTAIECLTVTVFEIYDEEIRIVRYNYYGQSNLKNEGGYYEKYAFPGQVVDTSVISGPLTMSLVDGSVLDITITGGVASAQPEKEYTWDITVNYTNGAAGELTFTNPGLTGWNEKYVGQSITVTPENNTGTLTAFDPSGWIVNNTRNWYTWTVTDPGEYAISYEITKPLDPASPATHGALTITVSGDEVPAETTPSAPTQPAGTPAQKDGGVWKTAVLIGLLLVVVVFVVVLVVKKRKKA